jgi:hypothetical protein
LSIATLLNLLDRQHPEIFVVWMASTFIAVGLLVMLDKIHWFRRASYKHPSLSYSTLICGFVGSLYLLTKMFLY